MSFLKWLIWPAFMLIPGGEFSECGIAFDCCLCMYDSTQCTNKIWDCQAEIVSGKSKGDILISVAHKMTWR